MADITNETLDITNKTLLIYIELLKSGKPAMGGYNRLNRLNELNGSNDHTRYPRVNRDNPGGKLFNIEIPGNEMNVLNFGFRKPHDNSTVEKNIQFLEERFGVDNSCNENLYNYDTHLKFKQDIASKLYKKLRKKELKNITVNLPQNERGTNNYANLIIECKDEFQKEKINSIKFINHNIQPGDAKERLAKYMMIEYIAISTSEINQKKLPYECLYRDGFGYNQTAVCTMPHGFRLDPGCIPNCVIDILIDSMYKLDEKISSNLTREMVKILSPKARGENIEEVINHMISSGNDFKSYDNGADTNHQITLNDDEIDYASIREDINYITHLKKFKSYSFNKAISNMDNNKENNPCSTLGSSSEVSFTTEGGSQNKIGKISTISGQMAICLSILAAHQYIKELLKDDNKKSILIQQDEAYYEVDSLLKQEKIIDFCRETNGDHDAAIIVKDLNPIKLKSHDTNSPMTLQEGIHPIIYIYDITCCNQEQVCAITSKRGQNKNIILVSSGTKHGTMGFGFLAYGTIRILGDQNFYNKVKEIIIKNGQEGCFLNRNETILRRIFKNAYLNNSQCVKAGAPAMTCHTH